MSTREEELVSLITKYAKSYYTGESEVSDEYFDGLLNELYEINPGNEILHKTGWGYYVDDSKKINHLFGLFIGSLSKIKNFDSIDRKFFSTDTRVSAKLDGLSVVSYYKNGRRFLSLTRGNGTQGIDVTDKMTKILNDSNIVVTNPLTGDTFSGAIRGEVVMPDCIFKEKYEPLMTADAPTNPRNIASGILNRDEVSDELENLHYVIYKILYDSDCTSSLLSINNINTFLKSMASCLIRCESVDYFFMSDKTTFEDFKNYYDKFQEKYPCDGLVITKVSYGTNFSYPVYDEFSFKFQAESRVVTVSQVIYEPSRTGRIVPVIYFDPVNLSGARVKKCTGYNAKFIDDNKIGEQSVIEVCRSNEVIPTVMRVIKPSGRYTLPDKCPRCGSNLHWKGTDLVCDFENEANLAYRFITTVAPEDGAGWSLYNSIVESLGLESEEDLVEVLLTLKNSGINSIMAVIENKGLISGSITMNHVREILTRLSQPIDPRDFLVACNINGISWKTSDMIFKSYPDFLKEINNLDIDKLYKIKGLGYKTITTILNSKDRISSLYNCIRVKESSESEEVESQFKVSITGSLSMKRSEFENELFSKGIEVSSNFKEIKYLITNNPDSTSSKMKKARDNEVPVISESEFRSKYLT